MQYKNPFPPVVEECPVPNKLISKVEAHYKSLQYVDIVRVSAVSGGSGTTKTVNQITFKFEPEGHPAEEVLSICEAAMQAVLYSASEDGLATYRVLLFVNETGGDRPLKKTLTLNHKEVRLLLEDEIGAESEGAGLGGGITSVQEEAFAMVKEVMTLNTTFHNEALSSMLEQNRELHDRLLEHSQNSTMASENMQKLLGTMSKQLQEAAVQKDRALSILHTSEVAKIEAQSTLERNKVFADMLKPALMVVAQQIAAKTGINLMPSNVEAATPEDIAAQNASEEASEDEKEAAMKAYKERFEREPVVCCLEQLKVSLSDEQWKTIDEMEPKDFSIGLRNAMKITDEEEVKRAMFDFATVLIGNPNIQEVLGELLTPDQQSLVSRIFNEVTGVQANNAPAEEKPADEASEEASEGSASESTSD